MPPLHNDTPMVLSFAGSDPTGGSGLSADVETLSSLGCHCTPVVTAIIARDTQYVSDSWAVESPIVIQQARAILEDIGIAAIKIGMLGSVDNIEAIHTIITDYSGIPVVLDPEFLMGSDHCDDLASATQALLLGQSTLTVLDMERLHLLAPAADSLSASAQAVIEAGCEQLLVLDSEPSQIGTDTLFTETGAVKSFHSSRPRQSIIGANCTYSAAIAAFLAHKSQLSGAIQQAQGFCDKAINDAHRIGMGNLIPNRFFWS